MLKLAITALKKIFKKWKTNRLIDESLTGQCGTKSNSRLTGSVLVCEIGKQPLLGMMS